MVTWLGKGIGQDGWILDKEGGKEDKKKLRKHSALHRLTWIGELEPAGLTDDVRLKVRPGPVVLVQRPQHGEEGAEAPGDDDGEDDREQLEDF